MTSSAAPGVSGLSRSVTVSRRTGFQMLQIETFVRRLLRLSRSVTVRGVLGLKMLQIEIEVEEGPLCLDL